jgi:hypothetical protein
VQPRDDLEEHFLQAGLHAGGEVGVLGTPFSSFLTPFDERPPVDRLDPEAAVQGDANGPAELLEEPRLPVRCERHDLVLVRRPQEPQVVGHLLVEEADRVWELLGGEHLESPIHCASRQVGGALSPAVKHDHRPGLVPGCG